MTIRNDATRQRIPTKDLRRPRAVVARQGQVLLDTDLDQQSRHQLERVEIETEDSLGSPGKLLTPSGNTGFFVSPGATPVAFNIGAGHGYIDGCMLENPVMCTMATQPHPRVGDVVAPPAVIAVKALVRYVDPAEETAFADVALRDAQASGRSLVDWQVFPFAIAGGPATCAGNAAWQSMIAPSTGTLTVLEQAVGPSTDPCSLTPAGGFTRKENLLYRFEVHGGVVNGTFPDGPRLQLHQLQIKCSRRNASVLARIVNVAGTEIKLAAAGLDPRNWFAPGRYAEIVSLHDDLDPRNALTPGRVRMFRVALAADDRVVLQENAAGDVVATGATNDDTWFLRLWDAFPNGEGLAIVSAPGNANQSADIDTGDGLMVRLTKGTANTFRRGDYWTCDARADGSIGWPKPANVPQPMTPHGPTVRYASLATMNTVSGALTIKDCRIPFATLSDRALLYRGGDGQSAFSGITTGVVTTGMVALPATLRVAVMRGETPVEGAAVAWEFVGPAGGSCLIGGLACSAANPLQSTTLANGIAEVTWSIDAARQAFVHQVRASLIGAQGALAQPIVFSATFETAATTAYTPGQCAHLAGVSNVQTALDVLCSKIGNPSSKYISLRSIVLLNHQDRPLELIRDDLILNGAEVDDRAFEHGIHFGMDAIPDIDIEEYDPIAEIELDLPYPSTDPDRQYWFEASQMTKLKGKRRLTGPFGFQRVRLDGEVTVMKTSNMSGFPGIRWLPSPQAMYLLESSVAHHWGATVTPRFGGGSQKPPFPVPKPPDRILCRIRLRSAHIWVDSEEGPIYLNAEHLGTNKAGKKARALMVHQVDPQRAGDLDMFIYLRRG